MNCDTLGLSSVLLAKPKKNLFSDYTYVDMCFLSDNIYDYYNVSQGKVTVPNMDDGEEFQLADVSGRQTYTKRPPPPSKNTLHFTLHPTYTLADI